MIKSNMGLRLSKRDKIRSLLEKSRHAGICHYLRLHPECIQFIPKKQRSVDYIKAAIESDGYILRLLDNDEKTLEICKMAINKNVYNLRFVPKELKTIEFLIYAVNSDYNALSVIEDQNEEICLIAMEKDPCSIYLINDKTEKIMLRAIRVKGLYKDKNIPQYYNAVLEYIKENGNSLQYIKREFKTFELCKVAIINSPFAIKYVPKIVLEKYPELRSIK
jgi:hypothetical protein